MLAEKLLEGYSGFYGISESYEIADPIAYLNEVAIEAVTALHEAAQQYYIGDIIAQSQVIMEGVTGEALMESAGSKAKALWEAFKKRVKEILTSFKTKMVAALKYIKDTITKTIKKVTDTLNKFSGKMKTESTTKINSNCIPTLKEAIKFGNHLLDSINKLIDSELGTTINLLSDPDSATKQVCYNIINGNEPARARWPINISYTVNGTEMTINEVTSKLNQFTNQVTTGNPVNVTYKELTDMADSGRDLLDKCFDTINKTDRLFAKYTRATANLMNKDLPNNTENFIRQNANLDNLKDKLPQGYSEDAFVTKAVSMIIAELTQATNDVSSSFTNIYKILTSIGSFINAYLTAANAVGRASANI